MDSCAVLFSLACILWYQEDDKKCLFFLAIQCKRYDKSVVAASMYKDELEKAHKVFFLCIFFARSLCYICSSVVLLNCSPQALRLKGLISDTLDTPKVNHLFFWGDCFLSSCVLAKFLIVHFLAIRVPPRIIKHCECHAAGVDTVVCFGVVLRVR